MSLCVNSQYRHTAPVKKECDSLIKLWPHPHGRRVVAILTGGHEVVSDRSPHPKHFTEHKR